MKEKVNYIESAALVSDGIVDNDKKQDVQFSR